MEGPAKRRHVDSDTYELPAWSSRGKHLLRVSFGSGETRTIESSEVLCSGLQGVQLVFVPSDSVTLPVTSMEIVIVDEETSADRVLLSCSGISKRRHDGENWTCSKAQVKLTVSGENVTQMNCTMHALAYVTTPIPPPVPVAHALRFSGWNLLVTLRVERSVLFERCMVLRVAEIASEARQTVCFVPEEFDGEAIARPLASGDSDRLKLVADWTLWAPSRVLVCSQVVCFLLLFWCFSRLFAEQLRVDAATSAVPHCVRGGVSESRGLWHSLHYSGPFSDWHADQVYSGCHHTGHHAVAGERVARIQNTLAQRRRRLARGFLVVKECNEKNWLMGKKLCFTYFQNGYSI
jgi:hypothetical protein